MSETLAQDISEYVKLRDAKAAAKKKFDEFCEEHFTRPMETLEAKFLAKLQEVGADSVKTEAGTIHKTTLTSASVADGAAFRRFVIAAHRWDLVDWRANKTAVTEYLDQFSELPPGVNYSQTVKVGIRRS